MGQSAAKEEVYLGSQKRIDLVEIPAPPKAEQVGRNAQFAKDGEKRNRYHIPDSLVSSSPVGYRRRLSLTPEEGQVAMDLLSLDHPSAFTGAEAVSEQELFEEASLGILSARQSTNYRGHFQVTLGPEHNQTITKLLQAMEGDDTPILDGASYTHIVFSKPYRTPFTLLLTLVGHQSFLNMLTVPLRALRKTFMGAVDIPTIGYLQDLHVGVLAENMERAALLASGGTRRAVVHMSPFCKARKGVNAQATRQLEKLCNLSTKERLEGWGIALVTQVGRVADDEAIPLDEKTARRLAANQLAYRSERVQPGVNHEEKAPKAYHQRQEMDVPDALAKMCARAAYNAFTHWTGIERDVAKKLLLLERVDIAEEGGKERLRYLRKHLNDVTDEVIKYMPKWVDLPTGRAFSRNANRGRKAFALVGQRIYIGGLSRSELKAEGLDFEMGLRAFGAMAARAAYVAEVSGSVNIPEGCDLLGGVCLMAGPVNQNDIGKTYYGMDDLLKFSHPDRDPTSLLVWTLKAKTIADPVGNEEQLLNAEKKGALVDLRPGPHEVVKLRLGEAFKPMREHDGAVNRERAFADQDNFVEDAAGRGIEGNRGESWPKHLSEALIWEK